LRLGSIPVRRVVGGQPQRSKKETGAFGLSDNAADGDVCAPPATTEEVGHTLMDPTEADLIAAVLRGDAASFEPLIEKYSPRVFGTARRYARRESEVEDIVQEIWIKAFQKLRSFRGEAPFEHWLMRLAVRTCYDFLRSHQRKAPKRLTRPLKQSIYNETGDSHHEDRRDYRIANRSRGTRQVGAFSP